MKMMRKCFSLLMMILLLSSLIVPMSSASETSEATFEKPVILVGDDINYPPFSYLDEKGQPTGYNIDLIRAVAKAMGYDVVFKLDEWSKVRWALENGEIDAISGMFYSEERKAQVDFSSRHTLASGDIFMKDGATLSDVEALRGKTVVVQKGDIVGEYLKSLDIGIEFYEVFTVKEALALVESGEYTYAGLSKLPGLYTIQSESIESIKPQGLSLTPTDYCMAVKKGNEDMLLVLNSGLQIIKATGEFDAIYEKWLGVYEEKTFGQLFYQYRWILIGIGLLILILLGISLILNKMVSVRTRELRDANVKLYHDQLELESLNRSLEASNEELMAMEEELRDQFTHLLENEAKLKESEKRNRGIVNALPDIVFTFDRNLCFKDCQASNEDELMMPREVFLGKKISDVMPIEIADRGVECIQRVFDTGEIQRFEYDVKVKQNIEHFEMRFVKSTENEVIGISRNVSVERRYRDKIEYLSYRDQLTGLYNRRFFEEELKRLDVERNLPFGIVMADVNGLKLINDSFGHKMGDKLLVKVAEVLTRSCRENEVISRIGGDEFVILMPQITESEIEQMITRARVIAEVECIGSIELSISFGWEIKTIEHEDVQEIFKRAENFMYKNKLFEGPSMRSKTIGAIINTLNEKNKREEQHSQRVSELSKKLAQKLGFTEQAVEEIRTAGLLHDIGKIAINEEILNKVGRLTDDEYTEIKRHPEIGYRILRSVNDMLEISDMILSHHERWDGNGYPKGLSGEEIPLEARIISIADAYDAITSDRTYRKSNTKDEAIKELLRCSGTQFDPNLVAPFIALVNEEPSL